MGHDFLLLTSLTYLTDNVQMQLPQRRQAVETQAHWSQAWIFFPLPLYPLLGTFLMHHTTIIYIPHFPVSTVCLVWWF